MTSHLPDSRLGAHHARGGPNSSARTSSHGIVSTVPASRPVTRRAISLDQAASASASEVGSRDSMSRPASVARSFSGSRAASWNSSFLEHYCSSHLIRNYFAGKSSAIGSNPGLEGRLRRGGIVIVVGKLVIKATSVAMRSLTVSSTAVA